MIILKNLRVVLVEPTHPGNIGAVARAMANFGVSQLVLVNPRNFPSEVASARAASGLHILNQSRVVTKLSDAISDCELVVGTSARSRSIHWPTLTPSAATQKIITNISRAPVALIFGRESRGLSNYELDCCHYLVQIAVDEAAASLNLATAVAILLYEFRRSIIAKHATDESGARLDDPDEVYANAEDMKYFYQHCQELLTKIGFSDARDAKLQRKLIRMFNRARPYAREIRILRGIITNIEKKLGANK